MAVPLAGSAAEPGHLLFYAPLTRTGYETGMRRADFSFPRTGRAHAQYATMLALAGFAMACSPINATLLPLVIGFLIARRASAALWLIAPLAFLIALAVMRVAGLHWMDPTALYFGQADASPRLSSDAPSIWAILQAAPWVSNLPFAGLALASAVGAAAWLTARFAWHRPGDRDLVAGGVATSLLLVGLLPGMHWNSFLPVTALAVLAALLCEDRRSWTVAALAVTGTTLGLAGHLSGIGACAMLGAVPMIAATVVALRRFLVSPANDNGLPLNPFRAYPAGRAT